VSRRSRTLEQIVAGDVATITECYRVFTVRGWSRSDVRRAFNEAVFQEQNRPHGSLFPQGDKVELATICHVMHISPKELKKAVADLENRTA